MGSDSDNHPTLPPALVAAVEKLWRMKRPAPENLYAHPAFIELCEVCEGVYPNAGTGGRRNFGLSFALHNALRSTGMPCLLGSKSGVVTLLA